MTGRGCRLIAAVLLSAAVAGCSGTTSALGTPGPTGPPVSPTGSAAPGPPTALADPTSAPTPASTPAPSPAPTTPAGPPVSLRVVALAPGVSDEASGIAESATRPGDYFLVDDGTGGDDLAVVDGQGQLITRVALSGMDLDNAEALAAGSCGPVPRPGDGPTDGPTDGRCLYVGDIGDNAERRDDIVIYRAAEPDPAGRPGPRLEVAADRWHYTYPDGPHNAEALLVDRDGSLIVLTKPKNNAPHRMYRARPGGGELELVREFRPPDSPRPTRTVLTGNVVTDAWSGGGRLLLLTYDDVHEYTAPDPSADLSTFPDWPSRTLPIPWLAQAEGVTGSADGCGYVIVSETGPIGGAGALGIATCG